MTFDASKFPFTSRAARLESAIGRLEGIAFGRWLQFSAVGYGDQLRINMRNNAEIEGFRELPDLRGFADDLNAAMRPIIDAYVLRLRQDLANECVTIASRALSSTTP